MKSPREVLSTIIFALGLVFVFLVLSAQYESFIDPLIVLLAVPAALLGALGFMNLSSPSDPVLSIRRSRRTRTRRSDT